MLRILVPGLVLALLASATPAVAEPTPGANLSLTRIVPEAYETNDFISLSEARDYLDAIAAAAPDYVEVLEIADSVGWDNVLGGHDTFKALAVEVTNEASSTPRDAKKVVVFQLSIHGNEKGGREGALRIIEDLAVPRAFGEPYRAFLDEAIVVFTFPNVDGWMHEELEYRTNCARYFPAPLPFDVPGLGCVETQWFVRYNGHLQDMNRDWPTTGAYRTGGGREHALSEPEIGGMAAYLTQFKGRTVAASDIHGMLAPADAGAKGAETYCFPESVPGVPVDVPLFNLPTDCLREGHFALGMMRGYEADARAAMRDVRYADRAKEYLNTMAEQRFPYWTTLPNLGYAGGQWNEWGTVWDTLGYSDSGFTGLWFAQSLGAAGMDYELSYNHITFDNHYVPELNEMFVASTRAIVQAYLDEAMEQVKPALTAEGPLGYLADDRLIPTVPLATQEGPHRNSTADDLFEVVGEASPQRFWEDLASYLPAGALTPVAPSEMATIHRFDTFIVAGDAWDRIAGDTDALRHLIMHLDMGKRLLLTDSALRALEPLGLAEAGSVEQGTAYMGYIDLDLEHALAKDIRGLARETFEGIPLGFSIPDESPVWTVQADAVEGLDLAGTSLDPARASAGVVQAGEGEVVFLGALLPTPSNAGYHPYGLADYAVTMTGYQLVYNALGITAEAVPDDGSAAMEQAPGTGALDRGTPAAGTAWALGALALAAVVALRRRRA